MICRRASRSGRSILMNGGALADDVMLDPLKHAAQALGYALR
jgi:hypothetical protein